MFKVGQKVRVKEIYRNHAHWESFEPSGEYEYEVVGTHPQGIFISNKIAETLQTLDKREEYLIRSTLWTNTWFEVIE